MIYDIWCGFIFLGSYVSVERRVNVLDIVLTLGK